MQIATANLVLRCRRLAKTFVAFAYTLRDTIHVVWADAGRHAECLLCECNRIKCYRNCPMVANLRRVCPSFRRLRVILTHAVSERP